MKKFDTNVQYLKYRVLTEVAKEKWNDTLQENVLDIPKRIIPGKVPTMRCCVYKERAIIQERVKMALGGNKNNRNVIEVIDIACDECPMSGYNVTTACRGCLAHRCMDVCKKNAITMDNNHVAHIDKTKCIECGACAKVCPYSAIYNSKRPCEVACKVKAISMGDDNAATINDEKCIACGACVYQCPFGAISDKSYITNAIDIIKKSDENRNYKVYALVAPSISSQFVYAKLGQVITALKLLGFYDVVEVALGADMVANEEAKELVAKQFLTSSCCPSFVKYVQNEFPTLVPYISRNLSPMATIAKYLKEKEENIKIIFIGPCTSKKSEIKLDSVKGYVDVVLTFEELQALIDSKNIDITTLEETTINDASYFGRVFAKSGGLTEAVKQSLIEQHLHDFAFQPIACSGIEACKKALLLKNKKLLEANFIEGMACVGGCNGGAGCLTHGEKNTFLVDKYSKESDKLTIIDAINNIKK